MPKSIFRIEETETVEIITVYEVEADSYEDAVEIIQSGDAVALDRTSEATETGCEYHLLRERKEANNGTTT